MKKILNLSLILVAIFVSSLVLNVKAAGTVTWSGPSKVVIERTVENVSNPITNTFTYTFCSVGTGAGCTIDNTIVFNGSEAVSDNKVVKTKDLTFDGFTYTKPGDYTYTLTETATSNDAYPKDDVNNYTIVVSVRNEVDANNIPTGNFTASLVLKDKDGEKVTTTGSNPPKAEFVNGINDSNFGHLVVSKTVKGTSADVNEYFPITVTFGDSNTYSITGVDQSVVYNGSTIANPTETTNGTATIYLKNGQSATIGRSGSGSSAFDTIPVNTTYSVSENKGTYTATYKVNNGSEVTGDSFSNASVASGSNLVAFTNTKNSSPVTGVIVNVVPYILLVVVAICGTLIYTTLKARKLKEVM